MKQTYRLRAQAPDELVTRIEQDFPGHTVQFDQEIKFWDVHTENLLLGLKTVTIRYAPNNIIRVPYHETGKNRLPWIETSPHDRDYRLELGVVWVDQVGVAHVKDWPEYWSELDLFENNEHMFRGIADIYGKYLKDGQLQPEDVLSINFFKAVILR